MDEETTNETNGLRTFANVVFYLLLIVGALCIITGLVLAANGVPEFVSIGWTVILTGALCVLGAFGLRLILRVFADMADDAHAVRALLSEIATHPRAAAPSAQTQVASAAAAAQKAAAAHRSAHPPMPSARGTAAHPPMPPMRGSNKQ